MSTARWRNSAIKSGASWASARNKFARWEWNRSNTSCCCNTNNNNCNYNYNSSNNNNITNNCICSNN